MRYLIKIYRLLGIILNKGYGFFYSFSFAKCGKNFSPAFHLKITGGKNIFSLLTCQITWHLPILPRQIFGYVNIKILFWPAWFNLQICLFKLNIPILQFCVCAKFIKKGKRSSVKLIFRKQLLFISDKILDTTCDVIWCSLQFSTKAIIRR